MADIVLVGTWFFDIDGPGRIECILNNFQPDAIVVMISEELAQSEEIDIPSEFEQQAGVKNFLSLSALRLDSREKNTLKQTNDIFFRLIRYEYRTVRGWARDNNVQIRCADIPLEKIGSTMDSVNETVKLGMNMFFSDEMFAAAYQSVLREGIEAYKKTTRESTENIYQMREFFKQAQLAWRRPDFQAQMHSMMPHALMETALLCYNSERCELVGSAIKQLFIEDYQRILALVQVPSLWMVFSELANLFNPRVFTLNEFRSISLL